jgi:putative transposase
MIPVPPSRIHELAVLDRMEPNVIVTDPATKRPKGKPEITLAVDEKSKLVMGMMISVDCPAEESALRCLRHSIMPKSYMREEYPEIRNSWNAYGVPEVLAVGDGIEFRSRGFQLACLDMGIGILYSTAGCKATASLRYFFDNLGRRLASQKTMMRNNAIGSGCQAGQAQIPLDELEAITHAVIVDGYNHSRNRETGEIPAVIWEREMKKYPPRLPASRAELNTMLNILLRKPIRTMN